MRIPDPKANTTTEAYLAYKAGYLEESELKPVLYEPYLHFDAWLAYWAGLTSTYPVKNVGKNLFDKNHVYDGWINDTGVLEPNDVWQFSEYIPVLPNTAYTVSCSRKEGSTGAFQLRYASYTNADESSFVENYGVNRVETLTYTTPSTCHYIRVGYRKDQQENIQLEEGSTATSYEPYTGEPEMLTDEEALVAYLSGVTDTYPEEIKDPYDVRIVGYLKYLVSARWGRPEYPVNNEEFYLSTMKPPVVPSGDPSSDIEMDDTVEAPFIDLKMFGDTYQQTYSGKNLWVIPKTNRTINGVSYTYNSDGTFSLSGTPTASGAVQVILPVSSCPIIPGQTYTIWSDHNLGWGENQLMYYVQSCLEDGTWKANLATFTANAHTQTVQTTTEQYIKLSMVWGANGNFSNFNNIKTQVVAGTSEDSNFEPYVGGIPAPNPDYPQDIHAVTGEQMVTVTGKNLFDKVAEVATSPNYSLNPDGTITTNASNAQTGRRYMTLTMNPGTYTLSFRPYFSGVENPGIRFTIHNMDTSTDYIVKNINNPENGSLQVNSFTVENTTSVGFCIIPQARLEDGQTFYFYDTQLEVGSTATTYQPYQSQSYTVDLGSVELCKIGDYQDYIYCDRGGDWFIHKEIGDFDLSAGTYVATTSSIRGLTNAPNVKYVPDNKTIGSAVTSGYRLRQGQGLGVAGVGWFAVDTNRINFNTGGSTNPVGMLHYALATPTDTRITNSELISQLEALMEGGSYEDRTFIKVTATDPNLTGLLYVEAGKNV